MGIDNYITVVFWLGVLSVFVRSFWLCGQHPRTTETTIGGDVFGMLLAIFFLVWVSWLKFYS